MDEITADLLLADYAAVTDGKLTLVGAGFVWLHVGRPASIGIGVLVHVPWNETNTVHTWRLGLVDGDRRPVTTPEGATLELIDGFEMCRPPGFPAGSSVTAAMALNDQCLLIPPH